MTIHWEPNDQSGAARPVMLHAANVREWKNSEPGSQKAYAMLTMRLDGMRRYVFNFLLGPSPPEVRDARREVAW